MITAHSTRTALEASYDIEPKTDVEKMLHKAVHDRLVELIAAPMTARTLTEVQEFAQRARSLLIFGRVPGVQQGAPSNYSVGPLSSYEISGALGYDMPLAPAPASETFGAAAIREIIAAAGKLGEKRDKPDDTVRAIAAAREAGLHDIAKRLEEKLMSGTAPLAKAEDDEEPAPLPLTLNSRHTFETGNGADGAV